MPAPGTGKKKKTTKKRNEEKAQQMLINKLIKEVKSKI